MYLALKFWIGIGYKLEEEEMGYIFVHYFTLEHYMSFSEFYIKIKSKSLFQASLAQNTSIKKCFDLFFRPTLWSHQL